MLIVKQNKNNRELNKYRTQTVTHVLHKENDFCGRPRLLLFPLQTLYNTYLHVLKTSMNLTRSSIRKNLDRNKNQFICERKIMETFLALAIRLMYRSYLLEGNIDLKIFC